MPNDESKPEFATDDEILDKLAASAQLRLTNSGWRVGIGRTDAYRSRLVSFQHPLATSFDVVVLADSPPAEVRAMVDAAMQRRDVVLTKQLPQPTIHITLMNQLRNSAAQYLWTPKVLKQVTEALVASALLTDAEAEWLLLAGPTLLPDGVSWEP